MDNKRSKGVTVLGWYLIITAILGVISNLFMLVAQPPALQDIIAQTFKGDPFVINRITGTVSLLLSGVSLFLGMNILKLQEKWRQATVYYFILMSVYAVTPLMYAKNPVGFFLSTIFSLAFYIGLIYFLNNPKVKEQFSDQA